MTITNAEGNEFASQFMSCFMEGFAKNNHSETMEGLFADELTWKWSDGTEVSIPL